MRPAPSPPSNWCSPGRCCSPASRLRRLGGRGSPTSLFALVHSFASLTHWGGQIVSGVAINFVAAGSVIILGQVPAGRALGFLEAFRTFWVAPQPELRVLMGQIGTLDSVLREI